MLKPYTIQHPNPELAGEVHFRNLTVADNIQIGVRKAMLCNGARFDDLPEGERVLLHVVATLEQAITRAPRGFYDGDAAKGQMPVLNPARLAQEDEDILFMLYRHYTAEVQSFRRTRESSAGKPDQQPDGLFADNSSAAGQP